MDEQWGDPSITPFIFKKQRLLSEQKQALQNAENRGFLI
jgi:hypothetical protein